MNTKKCNSQAKSQTKSSTVIDFRCELEDGRYKEEMLGERGGYRGLKVRDMASRREIKGH